MLYNLESRVVVGCKSRNLTITKRVNLANQTGDQDYLVLRRARLPKTLEGRALGGIVGEMEGVCAFSFEQRKGFPGDYF